MSLSTAEELSTLEKLQLSERANQIYGEQLKYMQDHIAVIRSNAQDQDKIFNNITLRHRLGIISMNDLDDIRGNDYDQINDNDQDEIDETDLLPKALALSTKTMLENIALQAVVTELCKNLFCKLPAHTPHSPQPVNACSFRDEENCVLSFTVRRTANA